MNQEKKNWLGEIDAKEYAIKCHADTNCTYGDQPYSVHLERVVAVGKRFIELIPEDQREIVLAALWCHDVIEDTRQTYNDVASHLGYRIADLVYNVTNEMGRNRKERAEKTYPKIAKSWISVFVKAADRIANTEASKENGHGMYAKYRKEYMEFRKALYPSSCFKLAELWKYMDELNEYNPRYICEHCGAELFNVVPVSLDCPSRSL